MPRSASTAALAVLAAMALCACSEKPPRQDPEKSASSNRQPQNPLQQRAQTQNEAERIGN